MLRRILVGAVLIGLVVLVVWMDWEMEQAGLPRLPTGAGGNTVVLHGLPMSVMLTLIMALGCLELARMAAAAGMPIFRYGGMICTLFVGTLPFWRQAMSLGPHGDALTQLALAGAIMLLFAEQLVCCRTQNAFPRIGASLLAVCYLGVCTAILLGIRLEYGMKAFLLFLIVVKCADIGAYFVGSLLGRRKFIPWLSPAKTWEGLFGGLVAGALCGVAFVALANPVLPSSKGGDVGLFHAALFGLALGLVGQGGDLCESAMKRDAGLKDSGRSVPGFGGVLDVIDSPLLAAPVGYVLLALLR